MEHRNVIGLFSKFTVLADLKGIGGDVEILLLGGNDEAFL